MEKLANHNGWLRRARPNDESFSHFVEILKLRACLVSNIVECVLQQKWNEWIEMNVKRQAKYKANSLPANSAMILATAILLTSTDLVSSQEIQCTMEKFDSGEHCVFRDVRNTDHIRFSYPADVEKPSKVAFVNSYIKQLPSQFLTLAGPELKVLWVESCGLESVTITSGLEELYAKNNSIEQVIVDQKGTGGSLRILDLSRNQLSDVSDVAKCQTLEMLNLSGNNLGNVLDLGKFKGLNKLRELNLSYNDINYLDNTGNVNLESLEDLDLSHNNILISDLRISILYPYTKLHTLRFNNNYFSKLDYNHLLSIKSLKEIYLNGNRFTCKYLDEMLNHLHKNDLHTPPDESSSCQKILNDFCCSGPQPRKPTLQTTKPTVVVVPTERETTTTTSTTTTTEKPITSKPVEKTEKFEGDGFWSTWWFVIPFLLLIAAIGATIVICYRKRLVKNKANINGTTSDDAQNTDANHFELGANAPVGTSDNNYTPFQFTVKKGNPEIVKLVDNETCSTPESGFGSSQDCSESLKRHL